MRKYIITTALLLALAIDASASSFYSNEPLKLHVDMPAKLSTNQTDLQSNYTEESDDIVLPEYNGVSSVAPLPYQNAVPAKEDIVPYKFMDDQTFVGIPLFIAGIIAKNEKKSFRQDYENTSARSRLIKYNFHSEIDNYTQFAPMVLATGLNVAGVEGRSSFGRYLVSGAMAYGIMAAIVNPIKYTAKEMRPDGSTRNSWPSGHTATAFVSATILHKEYGLTRSPWYSVAGYTIATATGVMRVLNNRHWVSDVLSGAGIGIFSTELAYGLSDLIFKGKGLRRNDLKNAANLIENPSFFSISMGIGLGSKNMDFTLVDDLEDEPTEEHFNLQFQASTVVGAEAAYFFNKYIGVGGRLRVKSSPIKGWNVLQTQGNSELEEFASDIEDRVIDDYSTTIESDHITEFAVDAGVYFNIPLSERFAIGTKLLAGRSIIQDLDINATVSGNKYALYENGNRISTLEALVNADIDNITYTDTGETYNSSWDYFTLSGNNTMKYGTGISLTYAYKSSFSWKLFFDYDITRKEYTMTIDRYGFMASAIPDLFGTNNILEGMANSSTIKKTMHSFVIGGSFCVSF